MNKSLHSTFILVFVLAFCAKSVAQDTLRTSFGMGADTYVSNDDQYSDPPPGGSGPESVHGTENYLKLRNHEVRKKIVYLKFDIKDNPRFNEANEAFIGLWVLHAEKMAEDNLTVQVYGMTDDFEDFWQDTAMSYMDAPGMYPADLNNFDLNWSIIELLTEVTIDNEYVGYVYSEPTDEMDEFINADQNGLVTFILLIEESNGGDEVRFACEEDTTTNAAPLLWGAEPIVNIKENALANFKLEQNYPNPFSGKTTLSYHLSEPQDVELTIYNVLGKEVVTLVNEFQNSGDYKIDVNLNSENSNAPNGIYYARMTAGLINKTIRMIYNK